MEQIYVTYRSILYIIIDHIKTKLPRKNKFNLYVKSIEFLYCCVTEKLLMT